MENFEEYLIKKYPHLFYEEGDPCPCGAWVPKGWEGIVDELCASITSYTQNTYRLDHDVISKMYYIWGGIGKALDWGHKKFLKAFPQYNKWEFNKPFYSFVEKFRQRSYKCVKHKNVYPPAVKIDQIKEKYSGLRVYISGGDEQIQGMIRFAEHLCDKTCQNTGEKGVKCKRGYWYATLSESEMKRLGYSAI
jgi:hypothetical protein